MEEIKFCRGGGCTAKLGAGVLERVLSRLEKRRDENLLIGFESSDDASVYKLTEDIAVVQTLDFFPPMVEDPYTFGQIAAANALSDIYAMGADAKTALNIVCFPERMDLNILGKIMQGGNDKVNEAGAVLTGGHSIADESVKYGLSVMGVINPKKILANNTPKVGDRLILTKPLGVGIVCTAANMGAASEDALGEAINSMTTLNKYASQIIRSYNVHACTDVTGFGLLAHLCEMTGRNKGAVIYADKVPHIKAAAEYAESFYITAAGQRNRNHVGERVIFEEDSFATEELLFDAQTSGGLLAAIAPDDAENAVCEIEKLGLKCGMIGEITDNDKIVVKGKIDAND